MTETSRPLLRRGLCLAALLAIALLCVSSAWNDSATFDEPINLMHGLSCLHSGDWSAPMDYAPLSRYLSAVSATALGGAISQQDLPWTPGILPGLAQAQLYLHNDADRLIFTGRLIFLPLYLLLALAVYHWSELLWGSKGALLSLTLCALDPSLLAHSRLITNDFSVTAFAFLACYGLQRSRGNHWLWTLLTGIALGLALLSKHSALLCLPVFLFLYALTPGPSPTSWERGARQLLQICGIFGIALALVWGFYGFRYASIRDDDPARGQKLGLLEPFRKENALQSPLQEELLHTAESFHVLPEPYLLGIRYTWRHMERRLSFFLGERSITGNFWYFPVAFLLKTPLALILLLGLTLAGMTLRRIRLRLQDLLYLLAFPALYTGYSLFSHINLGQRYILPIYPFLHVLAGGAAVLLLPSPRRCVRLAFWGLLSWSLGSSLCIYPHYLSYFNELAGGPNGGIRYLGDSNLDWGQDLGRLQPWMERHGVTHIKLGYFGTALPQYYKIHFSWLPSVGFLNDQKGSLDLKEGDFLAVSATCLQGFYFQDMQTYRFLDRYEPIDQIGHSIYLFHITPEHLRR